MKKAELILIGIIILALLMKVFHLPGAGVLIILSLSSITIIYAYFGFALFNNLRFRHIFKKGAFKDISNKRIIGGVVTGLTLCISIIGILFKLQSWPGATVQLVIGLIGLVLITVISLFKIKLNDSYYQNILKRVVFFGVLCVLLFSIPTKNWLHWQYPNNPEFVNAILDAQANPENKELSNKVDTEREKMYDELDK